MTQDANVRQLNALRLVAQRNKDLAHFLNEVAKSETMLVRDIRTHIKYMGIYNALREDGLVKAEQDDEHISDETRIVFTPLGERFYAENKDAFAQESIPA